MPSDGRRIQGNSAHDMKRFGYAVLEYDIIIDCWVGAELDGTRWEVSPEELERVTWSHAECEDRVYRVARPDALRAAGARHFALRNVHDARNQ